MMKSFKLTLATFALLLAACSPAAQAQTPTVTSVPAPTNTTQPTVPQPTVAETLPTAIPAPTEASVTNTGAATTNTAVATTASVPAVVAAAPAQSISVDQYENFASPIDLLASYYNAVDRQEYERAYGYWQEPPLDYETFASGYADTDRIQLIVQPPTRIEGAAGSLYAEIATVLVAQHTDGSMHTYGGCIVTRKSNLHPPDVPEEDVWHIYQARLEEIPNNISIPNMLAQACAS